MSRKNKIILGLIAVALGVFAFTDLQISMFLFGKAQGYGHLFEAIGEMPMAFIGTFSAAAMIVTSEKKKSLANFGFALLFLFNGLMTAALPGLNAKLSLPVIGLILVIALGLGAWLPTLVPAKYQQTLRQVAKIGLLLGILAMFVINGVKFAWGRERMRHMSDPLTQFTPWYLPQGLASGNEFMSFPSGHSANGAVILWITLLPLFIDGLKKAPLEIFAWVWTILTMVSRIVVGAHFASDVTMGMAITFVMFLVLKCKFLKGHEA